jgi:pimeloyl-ACP methyl ester carboxylesterase
VRFVLKCLAIVAVVVVILLAAVWLRLRGPDIPYDTLEAKYADSASHFVDLPGSIRAHYQQYGDPRSPLLVLLHGFGDSYTSWEGWAAELKNRFHVISLDFPGHGLTRAPAGYQLAGPGLADFARKFVAAIPGAKLILYPRVGHLPQIEIPQRSAADVASFLLANPPAPVSSAHATGLSG